MRKLKAGIVGCGGIANGKHLPAMKKSGLYEIVAFCDIIRERAEKAKKEYGTEDAKVFEDYQELIKEDLDVVYVTTPNRSHAEISIAAMEAGKDVMCEKPMAKNYAEAQKMVETAEKTGRVLNIGYQNRYRSDSLYLKEMCKADELGEIYFAKAHALRRRAVPTWGVFLNEEEQGGGPLIDIGTHALDLTLWMMDNYEVESVTGQTFRKLADQTMQATQDVESLLATIQQQVDDSSTTMEAMDGLVKKGVALSSAAGESIKAASQDISTLIEHVHAIATTSAEQTDKVNDIVSQIGKVAEGTHQQLDDAHQLAVTANQVRDKSDLLLAAVGNFRFEGHQQSRDMIAKVISGWNLEKLDGTDLDRKLVALCKQESAFEMICITDMRGIQVTADVAPGHFDEGGRKNNWSNRRWFLEAIKSKELVVSDLYRSVDTGEYCFTVSSPLFDSKGRLLGVFEADINFSHIVGL